LCLRLHGLCRLAACWVLCECPQCEQECAGNDCGPDGFHVMVSLARGAASPLKMLFFTRRRANQLTMARKFTGREAASARNFWAAALLEFTLGRVNNKKNKKGVRGDERPLAKCSGPYLWSWS
jgi:hypothetical protein